jgi:SAM-dependent methyltransferase
VKSVSGLAYKSLETHRLHTYDAVAREYYDERLHPTCADFRAAASLYLEKFFRERQPAGRLADVGCGISLVAELQARNLVLIDQSRVMLDQNNFGFEKRCIDVEQEPIGVAEFDWIFAILGDPYNSPPTWRNFSAALKPGGQCVFIVPSNSWAKSFRAECKDERPNYARFITSKGETVFLRSLIIEPEDQTKMIVGANLVMVAAEHVQRGELSYVRSAKVSKFLSRDQNLLDIYLSRKP